MVDLVSDSVVPTACRPSSFAYWLRLWSGGRSRRPLWLVRGSELITASEGRGAPGDMAALPLLDVVNIRSWCCKCLSSGVAALRKGQKSPGDAFLSQVVLRCVPPPHAGHLCWSAAPIALEGTTHARRYVVSPVSRLGVVVIIIKTLGSRGDGARPERRLASPL